MELRKLIFGKQRKGQVDHQILGFLDRWGPLVIVLTIISTCLTFYQACVAPPQEVMIRNASDLVQPCPD